MIDQYNFYKNKLNKLFEDEFLQSYKGIRGRNKSKLLKYAPSLYRKWFYSSLVENAILSPATILERLKNDCGIDDMTYDSIFPQLTSVPKIEFGYRQHVYSMASHPIVNDLKLIVSSCEPFVEVDEENMLLDPGKLNVSDMLSIQDDAYASYLLEIAVELKLCVSAPAIHIKALQPAPQYNRFFDKENEYILRKIFKAVVNLFARFIEGMLPFEDDTEKFIYSILKEPILTDEIYSKLYAQIGIDIDLLWDENERTDMPKEASEYLNLGLYFLGIGIDKYFFTPMGYYLKALRPLYIIPSNISDDLAVIYNALRDTPYVDSELFSPCTHYTLTSLGMQLLKENKLKKNPNFTIDDSINILQLISSLRDYINHAAEDTVSQAQKTAGSSLETVFQLKFTLSTNKRFWLTLETGAETTLSELHQQLSYAINNSIVSDYSFFVGMEESPFKQYTPSTVKRKPRKTEDTKLSDLKIAEKDRLLYVTDNQSTLLEGLFADKKIKFGIELIKIKAEEYSALYPRIYKKSSLMKELISGIDF